MRGTMKVVVLAAAVLVVSACSARTQLAMEETKKNGAHFATWNHMGYSVNRGTPETTTKSDIELSQKDTCTPSVPCKWFGEPVMVQPIQ